MSAVPDIANPALATWLEAHVDGFRGPVVAARFEGGQSNPSWRLEAPGGDLVLRARPMGDLLPGAHAIEREYRVLAALHPTGFPVARPRALCHDAGIIGAPFYVMDMVAGRIIWDAAFAEVPATHRFAHFDAMNATIAALHRIDPVAVGLGDYGRPGNYFERQIARWSGQYAGDAEAGAGRDRHMDRLVEWLPATIPPGDESAIVHGDFRCDNMIFDAEAPRVRAVLDWELSTLGHPLADFAYHAMMYRMPAELHSGIGGRDPAALGLPSEADYIATYCRRTGRAGIGDFDWYVAFNVFRFAAIVHGIKGRVLRGTASSPRAREAAERFEAIAELGWQQALRAGAPA